jgi:hypothetical protein
MTVPCESTGWLGGRAGLMQVDISFGTNLESCKLAGTSRRIGIVHLLWKPFLRSEGCHRNEDEADGIGVDVASAQRP